MLLLRFVGVGVVGGGVVVVLVAVVIDYLGFSFLPPPFPLPPFPFFPPFSLSPPFLSPSSSPQTIKDSPNSFTTSHYFRLPLDDTFPSPLEPPSLLLHSLSPPHFEVGVKGGEEEEEGKKGKGGGEEGEGGEGGGGVWCVEYGSQNVFVCIVLFLDYVKKHQAGCWQLYNIADLTGLIEVRRGVWWWGRGGGEKGWGERGGRGGGGGGGEREKENGRK